MATIDQARAAKQRASALLAGERRVNGIGVGRVEGGFCVRVDLLEPLPSSAVPSVLDGVPVRMTVTGPARALVTPYPPDAGG